MTLGLSLLAVAVATAVAVGYRAVRLKRRIRPSKGAQIAYLEDGEFAKIVGQAVRGQAEVEAPISGVDCLFAHAWMDESREGAKLHGFRTYSWADGEHSIVSCDFWLEDESGRALIEVGHGDETVPMFGSSHYSIFSEGGLRGQEAVVQEGDTLTVVGRVTRTADHDAGPFRSSGHPSILVSGSKASPIFLHRE